MRETAIQCLFAKGFFPSRSGMPVIGRSRSAPPILLMYIPSVTAYVLKPIGLPPRVRYLHTTKPAAANTSPWPQLCLCEQCKSDRCYPAPWGPSPPGSAPLPVDTLRDFCREALLVLGCSLETSTFTFLCFCDNSSL